MQTQVLCRSSLVSCVLGALVACGNSGTTTLPPEGTAPSSPPNAGLDRKAPDTGSRGQAQPLLQLAEGSFEIERLVSDVPAIPATFHDPLLVNPWGLASGPKTMPTFWWVANNGTGTSTLYDGEGNKQPLEVNIAGAAGPSAPTGLVFHGGDGFPVADCSDSGSARFIFASEDGTIAAWSPAIPPPPPSHQAFVEVNNSASGAIYKGLALATTSSGERLYATDFHNNKVDVFDSEWKPVDLGAGAFKDCGLPAGYAPFGIRFLNGYIIVTYALQDENAEDDVKGAGHGFIDAYNTDGLLLFRVASMGVLDSPWGLVIATPEFGKLGGLLLVGNFGDGRIHAFDLNDCSPATDCALRGALKDVDTGDAIVIDGLWALDFGKDNPQTGDPDGLYFTSGPNDEADGLFGYIEPSE